jgi:chemotaxis protein MotB
MKAVNTMRRTEDKHLIREPRSSGGARWLTTFNDMITLLMVFFVLLFAMGNTDVDRFQHFQNALQSAVGILNSGEHAPVGILSEDNNKAAPLLPADQQPARDSADLSQLNDTRGLEAEYTKRGIQLILNDELLFTSGSARLTRPGVALLDKVSRIIGPLNRLVRVEGHTDNVPISTERYPSNWELSTARAVQVVKYLYGTGGIPARHLSAAGYGASRPRESNDSESGRSKNRRVEIILQQKAQSQFVQ